MLWIEEYHGCGCSADAPRKKDLLGYCNIHGGDRRNAPYRIPDAMLKDAGLEEPSEEDKDGKAETGGRRVG